MKAVELSAKNMVIAVLALLAATVIFFPDKVQDFMAGYSQEVGTEVDQEAVPGEVEIEEGQTVEIIAISAVNFRPLVTDKLNETTQTLNPTFRYWREGATESTTATLALGTAAVSLAPNEEIEWAAGTDNSIYWEKDKAAIGATDTPLEIKVYQIASSTGVSVKVFDSSYTDLSNKASHLAVGTGEDVDLQLTVDVTDEYRAIKRPHICAAYNDSVVNKVKISGLYEVDAPTRVNSTLDQCFDTGLTYYIDSDTRLMYDVKVDHVTGAAIGLNANITWHVLDQDIWYRDGKYYFVNPLNNNNMGSTSDAATSASSWITETCFS